MRKCHHCGIELPDKARFCYDCGTPQLPALEPGTANRLDLEGDLNGQLTERFFQALHSCLENEQDPRLFDTYMERLYATGFRDTVYLRMGQLAEEIRYQVSRSGRNDARIEAFLEKNISDLLDYFLINHCNDLNLVPLPEAILRYQHATLTQVDLLQMILDYLDLSEESEQVYLYSEFLSIPAEKLRNAGKSFLFPEKDEKIFLISDQSLFSTMKEGFAFTERAFYWKAPLEKPRSLAYGQIREVQRTKDWITINGHFFNVNPALNVKMLKLLKHLNRLYAGT